MAESGTPRTRQYDIQKANAWSLVFYGLLVPVYLLPYYAIWVGEWDWQGFVQVLKNSGNDHSLLGSLAVILVVFGGIVVHELVHGLTWAYHARQGWQSIRFGVFWKALAPYCHCE